MKAQPTDRIVHLRLFLVSSLWGCNYVASAYLLRNFSPIFLSFSGLVLASLFFVSVAFFNKTKLKRPSAQEWILLLLAGFFGMLLNQAFYFTGLQHSTAGNAALIMALSPIATTFLARVFIKESLSWFKLAGACLALFGVGLIVLYGGKASGISIGDVYLLLAMLVTSIAMLFVRSLIVTMPSYDATIFLTPVGSLLMIPAVIFEAHLGQMHFSFRLIDWALLLSAAVIAQGALVFWWNQGIAVVGASTSAMFLNIPPFIAILIAFFVLGNPIGLEQIAGSVFILLGVAVSNKRTKTRCCQATTGA